MTTKTPKKRIRDPFKMRAYRAKWRMKNPEKNKMSYMASRKRKLAAEPWYRLFISLCTRCYNKSHHYYKNGIKCFIGPKDIKMMWLRDGADKMVKPSLDRKNDAEHYTLENCHIIEFAENMAKRYTKGRKYNVHR